MRLLTLTVAVAALMMATVREVNSLRLEHVADGLFEEGPEAGAGIRPLFPFAMLGLVLLGAVSNLLLGLVK